MADAVSTTADSMDNEYDGNDNMISDANKGITGISYNHINLPWQVTVDNTGHNGNIQYIYDATGVKQKKTATDTGESSVTITEYANGYVYEGGTGATRLQFFPHPEGYVKVDNGEYGYVYQYRDHLGNVRLSYSDADGNGSIDPTTEILSESNYYPFGLLQKGYNNVVSSNANSTAEKFKYNGKELEEELGKDTYAYGWRDYDPAIGRFNKIDRFAEKYYSLSTYSYAGNNPVLFVDVQGDSIAAGSQKQYDRIKNSVTKTRDKLQGKVDKINAKAQKKGWSAEKKASKIGNLQERVASLDGTLSTFGTLESSTQVYELKSGQTEGGITYDTSSGNIVIGYGNTANFVHEATHAGQF